MFHRVYLGRCVARVPPPKKSPHPRGIRPESGLGEEEEEWNQTNIRLMPSSTGRWMMVPSQGPLRAILWVVLLLGCSCVAVRAFVPTVGTRTVTRSVYPGARIVVLASSSNSESDEKNKRSKRRARRKGEGGGKARAASRAPSMPALSQRDEGLDDLIEDEKKSSLPRLEDLKRIKSGAAGGALGVEKKEEDAGKSTFMLPRELEEMKLKEKVKEPPKGAPAYFDTMTKVTWGAIALMIAVELLVHAPFVNLTGASSSS